MVMVVVGEVVYHRAAAHTNGNRLDSFSIPEFLEGLQIALGCSLLVQHPEPPTRKCIPPALA